MSFTVNFIERRDPETGSIEAVFSTVGDILRSRGVNVVFQKLPFANNAFGMIRNAIFFRPRPADIYHITGHAHYVALRLPAERTVLTVHDLGILGLRKGLRRLALKKLLFDWPMASLRYVTAISENTKRELAAVCDHSAAKIRVIGNPLRRTKINAGRPFDARRPTILQVGTAPNKNLENLISALVGLPVELRIVGKLSPRQVANLENSKVVYTNRLSLDEDEMFEEYAAADIVTFCSTFEGFGLPIIEAQAAGKPLVTSNLSPMCDTAGDGAVFADPDDPCSIRSRIEELIADQELRKRCTEAGFRNIRRFEPAEIANQYHALYTEILASISTDKTQ